MQSRFILPLGLGIVFSSAFIVTRYFPVVSNGQKARSLAPRQAAGVLSDSDFLRRAGHACRLRSSSASEAHADRAHSRCCGRLGIH